MVNAIWLDIKLDQDCMPNNNLGKFGDDPMKNVQVRERTKVKCVILTKSLAITQNVSDVICNHGQGLTHILTFCASLVKIQRKLF